MRWSILVILILFCGNPFMEAQVKTVFHDGYFGLTRQYYHDTLSVHRVDRGGPAHSAGLRKDDIILAINGETVSGAGLRSWEVAAVMNDRGGTPARFTILHKGEEEPLELTVIRDTLISFQKGCYYEYLFDPSFSMGLQDILTDSVQALFTTPVEMKIRIRAVEEGSPAEALGLEKDDRLISLRSELDNTFSETDIFWGGLEFKVLRRDFKDTILTVERGDSIFHMGVDMESDPLKGITSHGLDVDTSGVYWLRMNLENRSTKDRTFLFELEREDSVTVFVPRDSLTYDSLKTGWDLARKDVSYQFKDWNVVKIPLGREESKTVYVRQNRDTDVNPWIPIVYYSDLDYLLELDKKERILMGLLLGMMLIIAVYYFVLTLYMKNRSNFFYALFILFFAIALFMESGYAYEYISDTSTWNKLEWSLPFEILSILTFLAFGVYYLELKSSLAFWYKFSRILLVVTFIAFIVMIVLVSAFSLHYSMFIVWSISLVTGIGTFLAFPAAIVISILRIRQKYKPARLYLITFILLITLLIVRSSMEMGVYYFSAQPDWVKLLVVNSIHIGVVVTILLFAAALGQRMRASEREKRLAQEKIIEQLKENERLKDKVNRELEQKVRERTREITEQKEEIESQRDEIEAQRDQLHQQHQLVVTQKKELTDSIAYAKRIQSAVLPTEEYLQEVMPEHFVLFKPRDLVSGDFYWIREVRNFLIVAAADCTGHGVPGGFMSMLGISFLNDIVGRSRFDQPGEILDRLRKKVKDTLAQEGKEEEQKDGMDMALAIFNRENNQLEFAGAFNPLYLARNRDMEDPGLDEVQFLETNDHRLYDIKGDRQPIGIYSRESEFHTKKIQLQKGDAVYMFSDGFADQIGGPRGKKYMSKKFKKALLCLQHLSMEEQKAELDQTLETWRGDLEQVDDILVVGIRI